MTITKKTQLSKILTRDAVTVVVGGKSFTMSRDHKLFDSLLLAISAKNVDEVQRIIDIASTVNKFSSGKVTVKDGVVYYDNEQVHNLVADRIIELMAMKLDFEFMAKFLENLMQNPSYQSRQELYLFLENGKMPITEDGRFMAFKWVRDDYKDCHTGTIPNTVGSVIKMERGKVNDDRTKTCSYGLHVCTQNYTKFGTRLMVVAVNPKDVVSVPNDYNNAKMRVCEYEVIKEIDPDDYKSFETPLMKVGA